MVIDEKYVIGKENDVEVLVVPCTKRQRLDYLGCETRMSNWCRNYIVALKDKDGIHWIGRCKPESYARRRADGFLKLYGSFTKRTLN